jgi:hypothetical protein
MRKLLISAAILLTLSSSAFAFAPLMNFFVNREVATARIWNTTGRPIVCSGVTYGQTFHGLVLTSWFNNVLIAPSVYVDSYVRSNFYDPFVRSWAHADCQFTR